MRSLFIVLTFSAIVLGKFLWRSKRIDERVAIIERLGGTVTYQWESKVGVLHGEELKEAQRWRPAFTLVRNFIDHPDSVKIHDVSSYSDVDRILIEVKNIGTIRSVHVSGGLLSTEQANELSKIIGVREAYVHNQSLTAKGAQYLLLSTNLEEIDLSGCIRIGENAEEIRSIAPNVRRVTLRYAGLSQDSLERLRAEFPHCEIY